MVKGSWIISIKGMRCKNWVNGIEVIFHLNEWGQLVGKIMPLPGGLRDKLPPVQDRNVYVCHMWQRACTVFYKAYYRSLSRGIMQGKGKPEEAFHILRDPFPQGN
jgi:hypothetical protein